jgi:hypothetical protein
MSSYISLYNEVDVVTNNLTVTGDVDLSEANIIVGSIKFNDGTAPAPSITFASDTDTGLYRQGTNTISVTTGGTERLRVEDSAINAYTTFKGLDVSLSGHMDCNTVNCIDVHTLGDVKVGGKVFASNPQASYSPAYTFTGDDDTGMYSASADTLSFSATGVELLRLTLARIDAYTSIYGTNMQLTGSILANTINANIFNAFDSVNVQNNIYNGDGSASRPAYSFGLANNLGLYRNGANTISISCGGTEVSRFNDSLIQMYKPIAMGTNYLACGAMTCGAITSSGAFTNGTNSLTTGSLSCSSISST